MIKESVLDYILKENEFGTERDIYEKEEIVKAIFKLKLKNEYKDFDRFIKIECLKEFILDQKDYINTLEEYVKELEKSYEALKEQHLSYVKKMQKYQISMLIMWTICLILSIIR